MRYVGLLAVLSISLPVAAASAQTTVAGMSGNLFRYHGDTIWLERDSTMTRSVTRGDTVEHETSINGQPLARLTYVLHGDSAVVVTAVNARGPVPPGTIGRAVPVAVPTFLNTMLENEIRAMDSRSQLSGMNPLADRLTPPASPETPRTYALSPAIRLVQHRDTVSYIRGCDGARSDTTKFVLFGADSVRRISKPERTFGEAMALSLTAQMRSSLMHEFAASHQTPLPMDLPKAPDSCASHR